MIRQPEFLTDELFQRFVDEVKNRKKIIHIFMTILNLKAIGKVYAVKVLHIGSYDSESINI